MVGGGWAGLAAAVRLVQAGHAVSLFEMARTAGGRARSVSAAGLTLDNGQHILIGAYSRSLDLMSSVGTDVEATMLRLPLVLRYPDGRGLQMPPGPSGPGFARAVASCRGWSWGDRLALLATATGWAVRGFRCDPGLSVAQLCRGLPLVVQVLLIEPLCVAALNTASSDASAQVFLRVLKDALFAGRGSADLLLPRRPLGELLPAPATKWLIGAGAQLHLQTRVRALDRHETGWRIDGQPFDAVVLACSAAEAARLAAAHAPDWATIARALHYEPIVTVLLRCPGARLAQPMLALLPGQDAPAQFVFDHGALGGAPGRFAFVISGAAAWVAQGLDASAQAVLRQAQAAFPAGTWPQPPEVLHVQAEKRATFRCTPALQRPPLRLARGLFAAGDYIAGPYPATLEGAVRAGEAAARQLLADAAHSLAADSAASPAVPPRTAQSGPPAARHSPMNGPDRVPD